MDVSFLVCRKEWVGLNGARIDLRRLTRSGSNAAPRQHCCLAPVIGPVGPTVAKRLVAISRSVSSVSTYMPLPFAKSPSVPRCQWPLKIAHFWPSTSASIARRP